MFTVAAVAAPQARVWPTCSLSCGSRLSSSLGAPARFPSPPLIHNPSLDSHPSTIGHLPAYPPVVRSSVASSNQCPPPYFLHSALHCCSIAAAASAELGRRNPRRRIWTRPRWTRPVTPSCRSCTRASAAPPTRRPTMTRRTSSSSSRRCECFRRTPFPLRVLSWRCYPVRVAPDAHERVLWII